MSKIIDTIRNEPIVSRVGLVAVLDVLVVAGVITPPGAEAVEVAIMAVINAAAILSGRSKVSPVKA